jgi:phage baseplate assembly protein W
MANYDSGSTTKLNNSNRATVKYSDLDLDFGRNPVTNDVNELTNVEAVKRSVRNLINTTHFDRPFHPEIGGDVRTLLFEPMTPLTALNLQRKVEEVLVNFEPRISLVQVAANPNPDANSYDLSIYFYVIGTTELVQVQTFLERLR